MFELHPQLEADTVDLGASSLCRILLMNDQQFPWLILVPQVEQASEIYQLDKVQQTQLLAEISTVSKTLMQLFSGHKLNTAALGNMVPQLHIHLIVRYTTDLAWPNPVWGRKAASPYNDQQLEEISISLKNKLQHALPEFKPC